MQTLKFQNGDIIPQFGLGTWKSKPNEVYGSVYEAIKSGYRHIDCAYLYLNEKEVGQALHDAMSNGLVKREELFITSKLWNSCHHPEEVEPALRHTLADLQIDYIDLYLIHWPIAFRSGVNMPAGKEDLIDPEELPVEVTWQAMQGLKEKGLARHLGVSNHGIRKIQRIIDRTGITPEVNQVEIHPYFQQNEMLEFCKTNNILLTAYYPLGSPMTIRGENNLLTHPVITSIAEKQSATPAQVLLAWGMHRGYVVIPKSIHAHRIQENIGCLEVKLDKDDMQAIAQLDQGMRISRAAYSIFPGGYYTEENIFE